MKKHIRALVTGIGAGALAALLIDMAVQSWLSHPPCLGGEFILPVLLGLVGYIGWDLANVYFNAVRRKEIYQQGFNDGAKIHVHWMNAPVEEDDDEGRESA